MQFSTHTIGIIIGGILPAVFFGLSGVFAKPSTSLGIGTGIYLILVGVAAVLVGLVYAIIVPDNRISLQSGSYALLVGASWAIGAALVSYALHKYSVPISVLVPIYNANSLIAILIGLLIYSEWRDVNSFKLITGAILILIGSIIISKS